MRLRKSIQIWHWFIISQENSEALDNINIHAHIFNRKSVIHPDIAHTKNHLQHLQINNRIRSQKYLTIKTMSRAAQSMIKAIIQTASFAHVINEHVFEITICIGPSMLPTFNQRGDVVFVERMNGTNGKEISKGDVVVAISPSNRKHMVCKRVCAVGGEEVLVKPSANQFLRGRGSDGVFPRSADDEIGDLDTVRTRVGRSTKTDEDDAIEKRMIKKIIPHGYVWLQGDNERNSTDSRDYGAVPREMIRGKVVAKVFPIGERKWVERDESYCLKDTRISR